MFDIVIDCDVCDGSGIHRFVSRDEARFLDVIEVEECEECQGSGCIPIEVLYVEEM